jgi:hypothetical protein
MSYSIISHNDSEKKFTINHKGYSIDINYPSDVDLFSDILPENLETIISGITVSYNDMPDYTEPEVITPTPVHGDWR